MEWKFDITDRPSNQITITNVVAANSTDVQTSAVIPSGESWHIERVIFAHGDDNRGFSGGFKMEWGSAGSGWVFVTGAFLTGNTMIIPVLNDFLGDGSKRFRLTRQNLDPANSKNMQVIIDGFKRIEG